MSAFTGEDLDQIISKISEDDETIYGYEKEIAQVQEVLANTKQQESSSLIIFGPRGSGKTCLLNHCLFNYRQRNVTIIHLDGVVHSTDPSALHVIAEALEKKFSTASEISSTLENICKNTRKSYIFILEAFDLFVRRQQMLLYSLFDPLHTVKGICIIGLTSKFDCLDLLEKRVRSRMDLRKVVLSSPFKSFSDYRKYALELVENKIKAKEIEKDLLYQYKKDPTPRELRSFLTCYLLNRKSSSIPNYFQPTLNIDHTIDLLESITHLEFAVVCFISTILETKDKDSLKPIEIYPKLKDIPTNFKRSIPLLYHALNRLVEYGLVEICPGQRSDVFLSDWTEIRLHVSPNQIETILARNKRAIPTGLRKILGVNQ